MAITAEKLSIANYNKLDNIPVINQDLTASGFTPVANTYYRHTGATTDTFTQGVIYLYDTAYHKLGESGGGTTLNKYTYSANLYNSTSTMRSTILHIAKQARNYIASIRLDVGLSNGTNDTFKGEVYIGGNYYAYSGILQDNNKNMALVYIINNGTSINVIGYLIKENTLVSATSNTYAMLDIVYYNDTEIT